MRKKRIKLLNDKHEYVIAHHIKINKGIKVF
jgi:hypothetical protein